MADGDMTQRDILLGLDQKVDTLIIQMATVIANADTSGSTLQDHETRIRSLERFRFAFPSVAVLGFVGSLAALAVHFL